MLNIFAIYFYRNYVGLYLYPLLFFYLVPFLLRGLERCVPLRGIRELVLWNLDVQYLALRRKVLFAF